ncbi:pyridoxal phosphate-dependent transferase [Diaporthe sp. PMI_573]|nr:pyridoxal phosphate-dependent transferase [Diaporthaceae sp. PMI_573]
MAEATHTPFGHQMLQHFLLDEKLVNLNHGSFGCAAKPVRDAMRQFQDASEAAPDRYIRYEYPDLLDKSRAAAASYLNVRVDELVIVPNVSTAVNAILRNLRFEKGDVIVYLDVSYRSNVNTIEYILETTQAESAKVDFTLPCSDAEILTAFRNTILAQKGRAKLVIFDTIASLPAVRLPFEEMASIAQEHGVVTLVDAAHGIGHLPLDIKALDPDFFTSNCHKWLFTPRGSAVLYVPLRNQHLIRSSLPTSHAFEPRPRPGAVRAPNPLPPSDKSNFVQQFEFVGTVDNASLLCIPAALEFRRTVCGGEAAIMGYCWELARKGGLAAAKVLGTEVMDNEDGTLTRQCSMVMVRLPIEIRDTDRVIEGVAPEETAGVQAWICETLVKKYNTFVAIVWYKGKLWARFSAQIYLDESDFVWGAKVLKEMCETIMAKAVVGTN